MIYDFSLRGVGLTVGILLVATHLAATFRREQVSAWLRALPRSRTAGIVLCTAAAAWALWLAATMDLGEFTPNRTLICGVVLAGAVMVPLFAEEFLAVRALGILALLAAEPLLGAAFLQPQESRLLLVVLAYAWAIAGLLVVGAPYLMRDAVQWITAAPGRFLAFAWAGVAYGVVLIAVSLLFFGA